MRPNSKLLIGLLVPHGEAVTWNGYWYNLGLATLGNIVGGAVFVAGAYWVGSPAARVAANPSLNGQATDNDVSPALALK